MSASSLLVECGELPLDLRRKLMASHALRLIATQNKSLNNKHLISNGRKSKAQARHHLMMKKKESPLQSIRLSPCFREIS